jgi:hypothetical protein
MYALLMSAQPDDIAAGHDVIHLGGETAVVVPLEEYRLLKLLKDHASAEEVEEAAVIAAHLADKAAGTVTGVTDDELEAALDRYKAGEPWA